MRLDPRRDLHLTYCTNVHAAHTLADMEAMVRRFVVPVKQRVSPGAPFGVGLRLSEDAAAALDDDRGLLREFRALLDDKGLYIFTMSGFVHGAFNGAPVKESMYLPDWLSEERLIYTNRLARLMTRLMPEWETEGSLSTAPGAFKTRVSGLLDVDAMADRMLRAAVHFVELERRTGKSICLALEPEPCCFLETIDETVRYFKEHLFGRRAVATVQRLGGLSAANAEEAIRRHLGVCIDTGHMAVEYEEPDHVLDALDGAGIRIGKVQLSAGLETPEFDDIRDVVQALRPYSDEVYLHQVVERRQGRLIRHEDLPRALARSFSGPRQWRIHYHVPLFTDVAGPLKTTRGWVIELMARLGAALPCRHFEVETYTWDLLPEALRKGDIVEAIARDLEWAAAQLETASTMDDVNAAGAGLRFANGF